MASREVVMSITTSENDGLCSAFSHQQCRIMEYLEEEEEGEKEEENRRRWRRGREELKGGNKS